MPLCSWMSAVIPNRVTVAGSVPSRKLVAAEGLRALPTAGGGFVTPGRTKGFQAEAVTYAFRIRLGHGQFAAFGVRHDEGEPRISRRQGLGCGLIGQIHLRILLTGQGVAADGKMQAFALALDSEYPRPGCRGPERGCGTCGRRALRDGGNKKHTIHADHRHAGRVHQTVHPHLLYSWPCIPGLSRADHADHRQTMISVIGLLVRLEPVPQ